MTDIMLKNHCLKYFYDQISFRSSEMSFNLISLKGGIWPEMDIKCQNYVAKEKYCN